METRTACSQRHRLDPSGARRRPRGKIRAPAGSCVLGPCSCEPATVDEDVAQVILGGPALGERFLEGRDSLRERWNLVAAWWQHIARDVQSPALCPDVVPTHDLRPVLHVLKGAHPTDDLLSVLRVEEVLGATLAEQARCVD